jgi:hypothetical protein
MGLFKEQILLNAVVATTTSSAFSVDGFSRVGLQFLAAGISAGNGVFTVEGTIDGINWVALSTLIDNAANTNVQTITRVASKTLSSNTSALVWLDNFLGLTAIRVVVTRTTDGTYSCFATGSE